MNLLAHIITCSPPSMNLPAHGTTSPDPSFTSQHDNENKKSTLRYKVHTQASFRDSNASTNLPTRGPTLGISPLVVQFYGPPRP